MGGLAALPAMLGGLFTGGAAAGTGAAAGGAAAGAAGTAAAAGGAAGALGTAATVAGLGATAASLLAKPKLPGQPKTLPMPDPEADDAARRRLMAAEMQRGGRMSTMLSGASERKTLG